MANQPPAPHSALETLTLAAELSTAVPSRQAVELAALLEEAADNMVEYSRICDASTGSEPCPDCAALATRLWQRGQALRAGAR